MICDNCLKLLFTEAGGIAIGIIAISFIIALLLFHSRNGVWSGFWRFVERHLYVFFGAVWFFGFVVYSVGMYIISKDASECISNDATEWWKLIGVAPMAVVHAFGMFVLESDVSAVHEEFHNSLLYMTCFSCVHFAAAFVSMVFVIKHFGYNMIASIQLWFTSHLWIKKEKLFVFWGMNEPSFNLAKDIKKNATGTFRIIFVKTADDDENTSERTGLERLFNFLSMKNKELGNYKELGCLTTNAFNRLSKCDLTEAERSNCTKVLKDKLGLKSLVKLFSKTTSELHIFMLGEDEESNIEASANLCCDADIKAFSTNNKNGSCLKKVTIYCHARYDSINRVVEDSNSTGNVEVRIVDSSHDSISELKSNIEHHPINFVEIDTKDNVGTVKSDFNCMVVGFGETGQDATRFLYEFGAFVSHDSSKEDDVLESKDCVAKVSRSGFYCSVIDHKMYQIKGRILSSTPVFKNNDNFSFCNCDINSSHFYEVLERVYKDLNYVVVALGDDELNITVAVRILNYVRRQRQELSKFRIFVRCHSTIHEQHLRAIADHYNEVNSDQNKNKDKHITIFGTLNAIYTYKQIVENDYECEGKVYNHMYCEASGNKGKKDVWKSRHTHFLSLKSLDGYSELRRKECQDIANAYHSLTKMYIIKKVVDSNLDDTQMLNACLNGDSSCIPIFCRKVSRGQKVEGLITAMAETTKTSFSELEQLLFRNLARLEHIRWNASHESLGYRHYSAIPDIDGLVLKDERHKCIEKYRVHNCIIGWEDLDAESNEASWDNPEMNDGKEYPDYKLYDFIVITTTLKLRSKK